MNGERSPLVAAVVIIAIFANISVVLVIIIIGIVNSCTIIINIASYTIVIFFVVVITAITSGDTINETITIASSKDIFT